MKLFIVQFSPISRHFISLRTKYSLFSNTLDNVQFPAMMATACRVELISAGGPQTLLTKRFPKIMHKHKGTHCYSLLPVSSIVHIVTAPYPLYTVASLQPQYNNSKLFMKCSYTVINKFAGMLRPVQLFPPTPEESLLNLTYLSKL
jgi:hypothetical protein